MTLVRLASHGSPFEMICGVRAHPHMRMAQTHGQPSDMCSLDCTAWIPRRERERERERGRESCWFAHLGQVADDHTEKEAAHQDGGAGEHALHDGDREDITADRAVLHAHRTQLTTM